MNSATTSASLYRPAVFARLPERLAKTPKERSRPMTTHEIITSKPKLPVYFDIYQSDNQLVPSHWHAHVEILYISSGSLQRIAQDHNKHTDHLKRHIVHQILCAPVNDLLIL